VLPLRPAQFFSTVPTHKHPKKRKKLVGTLKKLQQIVAALNFLKRIVAAHHFFGGKLVGALRNVDQKPDCTLKQHEKELYGALDKI